MSVTEQLVVRFGLSIGIMDFETAAKRVQSLQYCSDNDKLILYGLFKQGTVGDLTSGIACTFLKFFSEAYYSRL